jgi:TfoX/Sxy family transcriptional regulator of competence genes
VVPEWPEFIRRQLSNRTDVVERKMFGGLAFMVRGHMCCGVVRDELMVRVGLVAYDAALKEAHTRQFYPFNIRFIEPQSLPIVFQDEAG